MSDFVLKILQEAAEVLNPAVVKVVNERFPLIIDDLNKGMKLKDACTKAKLNIDILKKYLDADRLAQLGRSVNMINKNGPKNNINWQDVYNKVLAMLESGVRTNIQLCLQTLGIEGGSAAFYSHLTDEQKQMLKAAKINNTHFNNSSTFGRRQVKSNGLTIQDVKDQHEFFSQGSNLDDNF